MCGTPEAGPQYGGSRGGTGPVGFDAEFVFARPWTVKKCAEAQLPLHWINFQVNSGFGWSHPNLIGSLPPRRPPTTRTGTASSVVGDHKYAQFRLFDLLTP